MPHIPYKESVVRWMADRFRIDDVIVYNKRWKIERKSAKSLKVTDTYNSVKPLQFSVHRGKYDLSFIHMVIERLDQLEAPPVSETA